MLHHSTENKVSFISKQYDYVDFDPFNKKHRVAFVEFKLSGKWPSSVRFNLDPLYNNVPSMINQQLLDFYFNRDRAITKELKERYNTQNVIYPIGSATAGEQDE